MKEERKPPKPPKALLDKQAKAFRDAEIGRLMNANPLIKDMVLEKINDALAACRTRLEDGTDLPDAELRHLQGRIFSLKFMLNVVCGTTR